uniref:Ovule protein n=1 Tax=Schistosoma curassoni TaxID=6186 RepID=A0A183KYQ7_9TREM
LYQVPSKIFTLHPFDNNNNNNNNNINNNNINNNNNNNSRILVPYQYTFYYDCSFIIISSTLEQN